MAVGTIIEVAARHVPVVDAYETEDGKQVAFFCNWCAGWHRHAADEGDRVEHCWVPGGPYARTGYVLSVAGVLTERVRAAHAEREQVARVALRRRQREVETDARRRAGR